MDRRKDAKRVPLAHGEATNQVGQRKAQWALVLRKLMAVLLWIAGGWCFHCFCLLHRLVKTHLAVGHLQSVTINLFEVKEVLINLLMTCSDSFTSCLARVCLAMEILMLIMFNMSSFIYLTEGSEN